MCKHSFLIFYKVFLGKSLSLALNLLLNLKVELKTTSSTTGISLPHLPQLRIRQASQLDLQLLAELSLKLARLRYLQTAPGLHPKLKFLDLPQLLEQSLQHLLDNRPAQLALQNQLQSSAHPSLAQRKPQLRSTTMKLRRRLSWKVRD